MESANNAAMFAELQMLPRPLQTALPLAMSGGETWQGDQPGLRKMQRGFSRPPGTNLEAIMAIVIRGKTGCSICDEIFAADDDIVSTPHFIWNEGHLLWRFSDSGMHRSCFLTWEHAHAFRSEYNANCPKIMPSHPREMLADGSIVDL